jgi:hypothetical protein
MPRVWRDRVVTVPSGDWLEILAAAGYEDQADAGEQFETAFELEAWRFAPKDGDPDPEHYMVQVGDWTMILTQFFVAVTDADAFFATWWMDAVARSNAGRVAEMSSRVAKALVAFVRHGHGEATIDEYGDTTLDDTRRYTDARRRKAAAKPAGPVPS